MVFVPFPTHRDLQGSKLLQPPGGRAGFPTFYTSLSLISQKSHGLFQQNHEWHLCARFWKRIWDTSYVHSEETNSILWPKSADGPRQASLPAPHCPCPASPGHPGLQPFPPGRHSVLGSHSHSSCWGHLRRAEGPVLPTWMGNPQAGPAPSTAPAAAPGTAPSQLFSLMSDKPDMQSCPSLYGTPTNAGGSRAHCCPG